MNKYETYQQMSLDFHDKPQLISMVVVWLLYTKPSLPRGN